MNFIKKWLWRRNAVKVVRKWFEDREADRIHELFLIQKDLAQTRAVLFADCGYVQYEGSENEFGDYDFSETRLLAEHVMWDRITAHYGHNIKDKGLKVEKYDVAHPYDSGLVWAWIACGIEKNIKTRRIYFKVVPAN